jgi:hypothetical protein
MADTWKKNGGHMEKYGQNNIQRTYGNLKKYEKIFKKSIADMWQQNNFWTYGKYGGHMGKYGQNNIRRTYGGNLKKYEKKYRGHVATEQFSDILEICRTHECHPKFVVTLERSAFSDKMLA